MTMSPTSLLPLFLKNALRFRMIIKFKVNNLFITVYILYSFRVEWVLYCIATFCNNIFGCKLLIFAIGGGNKNIPNMNRKLFRNDSNVIESVPAVHILKSTKSTLGTDSSVLHLVMFRVNIKIFSLELFNLAGGHVEKKFSS